MNPTLRRAALPIAILVIGLPLVIVTMMAMGEETDESKEPSPFTAISGQTAPKNVPRAEPRWEQLARFSGNGPATETFTISPRAVQWRADWTCSAGAFQLAVARPAQDATELAASTCPDAGKVTSTGSGDARLQINASGPWSVVVRQQVDTALIEKRLAGMTPDALVARGRFHRIQKHGEGTVSLYRLANGRLALRFEKFYTAASPGLRVWLNDDPSVKSTLQARRSKYADVGQLRSTLGSYNQMLPATVDADDFHSVVIWCPTVLVAFTAAPLT